MPNLDLAMAVILSLTGAAISTAGAMLAARTLKLVAAERKAVAKLIDAHLDWVVRDELRQERERDRG
ncbi:hypothetical protein [Azospirillum sp. Marseille-Q6669]